MRNLSTLAWRVYDAPTKPWHGVVADTEGDDSVYVMRVERRDGVSQLTLAHITPTGTEELAVLEVASAPPHVPDVADFRLLADGGSSVNHMPAICVIGSGGDIVLMPVDEEASAPAEVVGSVDQGILAAAWSPEEDVLVLITGGEKRLIVMTREFEVMSETMLSTEAFGDDQPVNVGWGSKSTQFHGSEGKQAAMAAANAPEESDPRGPLVPEDDGLPRISWRGDGAFFVTSSAEASHDTVHRILRTYTRTGTLSATSDRSVRGISHVLACRPTGNLIATTQRMGGPWAPGRHGRHDVVFFERNGLRHGEFSLREEHGSVPDVPGVSAEPLPPWSCEHQIRLVSWNADGSVLAVVLQRAGLHVLQLWMSGNYHWYLKHESTYEHLHAMTWHPEQPLTWYVSHARVEKRTMCLETACSRGMPPHDAACASVVDGHMLYLTPFRLQNVPPPMCAVAIVDTPQHTVPHVPPATPVHVAWTTQSVEDQTTDIVAILYPDASVHVWSVEYGSLGAAHPRPRPPLKPQRVATYTRPDASHAYQVAVTLCDRVPCVTVLCMEGENTALWTQCGSDTSYQLLDGQGPWRLVSVPNSTSFALHDHRGDVTLFSPTLKLTPLDPLLSFCPTLHILPAEHEGTWQAIGLTSDGRLLAPHRVLAKDATSFTCTDHLLIWTTHAHEAMFVPLTCLTTTPQVSQLSRRVERGSRIVTAVPSAMSLVLQMPRGNLETTYPRPMVLDVIRDRLDRLAFGEALRVSRAHRVDLNLLHDHCPTAFLERVPEILAQIHHVDHINLLLSNLRNEDVTQSLYRPWDASTRAPMAHLDTKVNQICDRFLEAMQAADERYYLSSILTAHVRKVPADYESGLRVLLKYMHTDMALAEEACKYIIFLVNADQLYHVALGMYDFELALLIAQQSPRDPREYVPFLREMRAKEPLAYQRFCMDDYLGRHAKALAWLAQAGSEHTEAAMTYMVQHKLFREGLVAWAKDPVLLADAYGRFADYLSSHQRPAEAATAYELAGRIDEALNAHKEADQWQRALTLALEQRMSAQALLHLTRELADQLEEQHKFEQAARVLLRIPDLERAVDLLCRANAFVDAQYECAVHARWDLVETHVAPATLEAHSSLIDEADEIEEQLSKQVARLFELDAKRTHDPAAFYVEDDLPGMDNIDVMSDMSQVTQFTRYTTATSVAPSMSTLSLGSKSRQRAKAKKEEKKKNAGKKGSIYEEGYLHESLQKLLHTRLGTLQQDTKRLLPLLVTLGEKHRNAAQRLQDRLLALEAHAHKAVADLTERHARQVQERAEMAQTLATQVTQLAHAPGAQAEAASAVLATVWRWRHMQEPPKAVPRVSNEAWKLHFLERA
ncbi:Elongator complex protein 1 [Malassezia restricta CBS 7877]|uniref:Elongator complex protein 1 n=1 Tax=Malassezia restricta (strain ATCC 96810 / NBRC 103918 / CBS 7877) TaxID=425264 RepID=A0A3G2S9T7_MALR7|nr:Elongator complex protein 1 [Malassezia restricta CBS 7877]